MGLSGVLLLALGLPIFSYLTLIYRELGRMNTGRVHEHLEIFEAEIEPKLRIKRRSGGRTFRILGHFWLAFLVLETTRAVVYFVSGTWESLLQFVVFLTLEVVIAMHFIPDMLLYRTTGRWLVPLLPLIRVAMWLVWPVRVFLEGAESLARISEQEPEMSQEQRTEERIEALVEAAEEEGIIAAEQADLIEQVVEFSDKRVREVMTPRPDIVAMQAEATLEELHAKFVERNFRRCRCMKNRWTIFSEWCTRRICCTLPTRICRSARCANWCGQCCSCRRQKRDRSCCAKCGRRASRWR